MLFDTLLYTKKLEATGLSREQAEAQVNVMVEIIVDGVATKNDIAVLEAKNVAEYLSVRLEIARLRGHIDNEIRELRAEIENEFRDVRSEIEKVNGNLEGQIQGLRVDLQGQINSLQAEIVQLRAHIDRQIRELRFDLEGQIKELRAEMELRFVQLENRLVIKLGALFAVGMTVMTAVLALIK